MRRSPRNLRIACNHEGLTHFGGVYFLHKFLQVLQMRDFLARHLTYPRRNHHYSVSHKSVNLCLLHAGFKSQCHHDQQDPGPSVRAADCMSHYHVYLLIAFQIESSKSLVATLS